MLYAHSKGCNEKSWQSLDSHLENVARLASAFAAPIGSEGWAWNAGLLHDLGKASKEFQSYLRVQSSASDEDGAESAAGKTDHSSAGAAFAAKEFDVLQGMILAYLTAGHHAGLPDWSSAKAGGSALSIRLRDAGPKLAKAEEQAKHLEPLLKKTLPPPPVFKGGPGGLHLWIRFLFSCLVDADFLDTESFMEPEKGALRGGRASIGELKEKLARHMRELSEKAPKSPVNGIRAELLAAALTASKEAPGLFSLTVPTGGGKTLASMAFALSHAEEHGLKRVIYAIPYTSIVEQTAEIFSNVFGKENIVEHHCNLAPDKDTPRLRLAAENWDAPIIVTTNVQFFESLYAARTSRARKLHNIMESVVVLDEAQALPPKLLWPCADAMKRLAESYRTSIILSTATQPEIPGFPKAREIAPPELKLYERLKRTTFEFPEDMNGKSTWEAIAERLKAHRQVLCVVNARRDCHELFSLMPEGSFHLSALMCGAHRSSAIAEIKARLKRGEEVRAVSTQLVEAGVDIDFPVVFRALAGLDSIVQAGGRCNREGLLPSGKVVVFIPPKPPPAGLLLKGEATSRELLAAGPFDPSSPEIFSKYFSLLYAKGNDDGRELFQKMLAKDAPRIEFRTAESEFKMIEDGGQVPVFVRYGGSEEFLKPLRAAGPSREILRRLQRFTVSLSETTASEAHGNGLLEEISPGFFLWNGKYDLRKGVDIYGPGFTSSDRVV